MLPSSILKKNAISQNLHKIHGWNHSYRCDGVYCVQCWQNIERIDSEVIKQHLSFVLINNDRGATLFVSEGWAVDQSLWGRNKSSAKHCQQPEVYSSASYCRGTVLTAQRSSTCLGLFASNAFFVEVDWQFNTPLAHIWSALYSVSYTAVSK